MSDFWELVEKHEALKREHQLLKEELERVRNSQRPPEPIQASVSEKPPTKKAAKKKRA